LPVVRILSVIKRAPMIVKNLARDLRFGRPLGGTVKTRFAHLGAHDVGNATYDDLERLFRGVLVTPEDVLVDVGCGRGRSTNWFLTRWPSNRIVGIELDPDVCSGTAHRLRRHTNVKVICGDAPSLLPPDGTIFYLFNPFDGDVLRRFAEAVVALPHVARPRTIAYLNCKFLSVFENDERFIVRPIDDPALSFRSALVTVR